jgi:hypothetical protein
MRVAVVPACTIRSRSGSADSAVRRRAAQELTVFFAVYLSSRISGDSRSFSSTGCTRVACDSQLPIRILPRFHDDSLEQQPTAMPRSTTKKKKVGARSRAKATVARKKPAAAKRPATAPPQSQDTSTAGHAIGDRVSHQKFGDGVVTALDGEKLTIRFADGRTRQIIDYYVKHRSK